GHSLGEVAASVVAGALTLEDGARVAALRSRAIRPTCGRGRMALVELSPDEAEREIAAWPGVSIAAYHGAGAVLLAGSNEAIERLVQSLAARGAFSRLLEVDYASHSVHVDSVLPELARALAGVRGHAVEGVLLCSTVLGDLIGGEKLGAEYWVENL